MKNLQVKNYKLISVFILAGIAVIGSLGYVVLLKGEVKTLRGEKQNLLEQLLKEKEAVHRLAQENLALKENLKASEEKLARVESEFSQGQKTIEELQSQVSALKAENIASTEEKKTLESQLNQLAKEKEDLRLRLNSIVELKKAIRELKRQMRNVRREIRRKSATVSVIEGNRGFLLKDGKPTYPAKVRIEVNPASLKE